MNSLLSELEFELKAYARTQGSFLRMDELNSRRFIYRDFVEWLVKKYDEETH